MHKALHLQHHKHTGKLLHHRHTSYHALFLLLVIAGAFIALTNHIANAASYDVTATVPAPLPTTAAVITQPTDGAIVNTSDIQVGGTCPIIIPAVVVVLYDNGSLVGSTRCTAGGVFEMPVSISAGQHSLVATVVNITGQTGLTSDPVMVTYTPLVPIAQPLVSQPSRPQSSGNTIPVVTPSNVGPLVLTPAAPFLIFGPTIDAVWDGTMQGGTAPYTFYIDWGDGTIETHSGLSAGAQEFRHRYHKTGSYLISIRVEDSSGHSLTRHYVALSLVPFVIGLPTSSSSTGSSSPQLTLMPLLYSAYFTIVICFFIFWWYERRHRRQWAHVRISSEAHARQYHKQQSQAHLNVAKRRRHR